MENLQNYQNDQELATNIPTVQTAPAEQVNVPAEQINQEIPTLRDACS